MQYVACAFLFISSQLRVFYGRAQNKNTGIHPYFLPNKPVLQEDIALLFYLFFRLYALMQCSRTILSPSPRAGFPIWSENANMAKGIRYLLRNL